MQLRGILKRRQRLGAFVFLAFISACQNTLAPSPGSPCLIKDDQLASFNPRFGSFEDGAPFPYEVVIDDRFSERDQREIIKAIDEWNRFSQISLEKDIFTHTVATLALNAGPQDRTCLGFVGGSDSSFEIIKADDERWEALDYSLDSPGVAARCAGGAGIIRQAILINHDRARRMSIRGIALHELGHALGLDHSCDKAPLWPDPHHVACSSLPERHRYLEAVMVPSFPINALPTALSSNDVMRAYCHNGFEEGMNPTHRARFHSLQPGTTPELELQIHY